MSTLDNHQLRYILFSEHSDLSKGEGISSDFFYIVVPYNTEMVRAVKAKHTHCHKLRGIFLQFARLNKNCYSLISPDSLK